MKKSRTFEVTMQVVDERGRRPERIEELVTLRIDANNDDDLDITGITAKEM